MEDERLNVPSASGIERISLCPKSRDMELTQPETSTGESSIGDEAHALAARYLRFVGDATPWPEMPQDFYAGMDLSIADVVERFTRIAFGAFTEWVFTLDALPKPQMIVERRIVWQDVWFQPILTGKPDVVWISGRKALIIDLKSLNGEQTESVRNLQLRGYAVLVNEEYGCTEITVAIIQPRVSHEPQTCLYDEAALETSRRSILGYLEASEQPDAKLVAGAKQCKFCRANAVCPAAKDYAMIPAVAPERELKKGEAARIVSLLSIPERIQLWDNRSTIKRILDAVDENLKGLGADALLEHGLSLESSPGDRTIKDGPAAWDKVSDVLTPEAWNGCCSVGITKLENAFRAATHLPVKDTKAQLEKRLGDLLGRKPDSVSLMRLKKPAEPPKPAAQPTLELTAPESK